ncbi:hypothetical protein D3C84_929910 [compost metagenome]
MITLAGNPGADVADFHGADFRPGVAHQFTLDEALEPDVLWAAGVGVETVLDKCKVPAQRLGQVGIGFGQFDQQLQQLRQRSPGAAIFDRYANGTKACFLQPFHLFKRQAARLLTLQGAGLDACKDRPKALGQGLIVGAEGKDRWQMLLLCGHGDVPSCDE